jgi:hypothetical protein
MNQLKVLLDGLELGRRPLYILKFLTLIYEFLLKEVQISKPLYTEIFLITVVFG